MMTSMSAIWLIACIALLVFEILTLGLTSIWFAGGALAAFAVSLLCENLFIQIIVFVVVSLLLLFLTRPLASKYLNRSRTKTNIDALIGRTAVVTVEIDNLKGQGEISLGGQMWTARAREDAQIIAIDTQVKIVALEGVKAIVTRVEN